MSWRHRHYGIDDRDFEMMNDWGDGRCWICRDEESIENRSLAVDHCHDTESVRGLLCTRCNQVLGRVHDDARILRRAAFYLEQSQARLADGCEGCMDEMRDQWAHLPIGHIPEHQGGVRHIYECPDHGVWTCRVAGKGLPLTWQLGGGASIPDKGKLEEEESRFWSENSHIRRPRSSRPRVSKSQSRLIETLRQRRVAAVETVRQRETGNV